jgi:hypothetical protein
MTGDWRGAGDHVGQLDAGLDAKENIAHGTPNGSFLN